ncbi:MAG: PEP-CTERM sorting domain-containing protein [Hormoscilla sp.]
MNLLQKLTTIATVTTIATLTSATAQAAIMSRTSLTNGVFSVDQTTKVYFEFLEGHGMNRADFVVYEKVADGDYNRLEKLLWEGGAGWDPGSRDGNNDWLSTPGTTGTASRTSYTFDPTKEYVFVLENELVPFGEQADGTQELRWLNPAKGWVQASMDRAANNPLFSDATIQSGVGAGGSYLKDVAGPATYKFNTTGPSAIKAGAIPQEGSVTIAEGEWLLAWEDAIYGSDGDFNDFILKAYIDDDNDMRPDTDPISVPEPSTAGALLGVGVLGLFNLRRRKSRKNG